MEKKINSVEELNSLIHLKEFKENTWNLSMPFFDNKENKHYSKIINKNKNACGCNTGGYFLVTSVLICIFLSKYKISIFDTQIIQQIIISIIVIFISSLIGKVIGILYSKQRFNTVLRSINKIAKQRTNYFIRHF